MRATANLKPGNCSHERFELYDEAARRAPCRSIALSQNVPVAKLAAGTFRIIKNSLTLAVEFLNGVQHGHDVCRGGKGLDVVDGVEHEAAAG